MHELNTDTDFDALISHSAGGPFRCDRCGRFVPLDDLVTGAASRHLLTPDSHFTREEYETLCKLHSGAADA